MQIVFEFGRHNYAAWLSFNLALSKLLLQSCNLITIFICGSELTDISLLASYVHLRYIDLSGNNLRDVSALNSLSHLLTIQLSNNKLTSAAVPTNLPYLQTASFAGNRIQSLAGISHPVLESLNLNCKMTLTYT